MNSAFGVDHGDVAKAFNPIKAVKADLSRRSANAPSPRSRPEGTPDRFRIPMSNKAKNVTRNAAMKLKRKG